jgi:hypothetical protein
MFLPRYDGGVPRLVAPVVPRGRMRGQDPLVLRVVIRSLGLPQHADAHGPKDPILSQSIRSSGCLVPLPNGWYGRRFERQRRQSR